MNGKIVLVNVDKCRVCNHAHNGLTVTEPTPSQLENAEELRIPDFVESESHGIFVGECPERRLPVWVSVDLDLLENDNLHAIPPSFPAKSLGPEEEEEDEEPTPRRRATRRG